MKELVNDQGGNQKYSDIINENLRFIEKRCYRALQSNSAQIADIELENDVLLLFNTVLDKLKKNNYKILRDFRGKSKLTTYLTTIISFQAVDLIRKRRGRNLEKDRANKTGAIARKIYDLILKDGRKESDVFQEMKQSGDFKGSFKDFSEIIVQIRGKKSKIVDINSDGVAVKRGILLNGTGSFDIPDTQSDPELVHLKADRQYQINKMVKTILSDLSGENRLILKMRFPQDENAKPMKISEIAGILKISKKAVYNRLERIIKKCKQKFKKEAWNES